MLTTSYIVDIVELNQILMQFFTKNNSEYSIYVFYNRSFAISIMNKECNEAIKITDVPMLYVITNIYCV